MKRFSRIVAVLLTICVLCGIIVTMASADAPEARTENLGFVNDFEGDKDTVKSWIPTNFKSGSGSAGSYSYATLEGDDDNKYLRYSWKADSTKTYRRDLMFGVYEQCVTPHITQVSKENILDYEALKADIVSGEAKDISNYSYYTVDFDIAADQYRYLIDTETPALDESGNPVLDENGDPKMETVTTEYLSETYPTAEGAYGIRLAYSEGSYWNFDQRYVSQFVDKVDGENVPRVDENGDPVMTTTGVWGIYVRFHYDTADSKWKVYSDKAYTNLIGVLADEPGEWNHFTYVVDVNADSINTSQISLYFNGEFHSRASIGDNVTDTCFARALDWSIAQYGSSKFPNEVKYSMAVDNYEVNYYEEGYESDAGVYGIDNLCKDADSTSITKCVDVVCDAYYDFDKNNDKYVTVGGVNYYLDAAIQEAIKNNGYGSTVYTNKDLLEITPSKYASFDIECAKDVNVTLSEEAMATHVIGKTSKGYVVQAAMIPTEGADADLVNGTYAYDNYDGVRYNSSWNTGSQQLSSFATLGTLVDPVTKNTYRSITRKTSYNFSDNSSVKNNGNSGYNEWYIGDWNDDDTYFNSNNLIGNYDYAVFNMDIGADRRSAWVGYRVVYYYNADKSLDKYTVEKAYKTFTTEVTDEMLSAAIDETYAQLQKDLEIYKDKLTEYDLDDYSNKMSLREARESVTLAYAPGLSFYFGLRTYANNDAASRGKAGGGYTYGKIIQEGGDWYLVGDQNRTDKVDGKNVPQSNGVKYKLPSDPGQFTHVSFVVKVDHESSTATIYLYADGVLIGENSVKRAVLAPDSMRIQVPTDYKDEDIYGLMFDNMSVNYYKNGYESGSGNGIDDFIDGKCKLWECTDAVWNEYYVAPDGFLQVNEGDPIYLRPVINDALAALKDGDVITTSRSVYDLAIPEGAESIKVNASGGASVSLSDESSAVYYVKVDSASASSTVYLVKKTTDAERITVNFVNSNGKTFKTAVLAPNDLLDLSDVNSTIFDPETNAVTILDWYWDLDGDGDACSPELAFYYDADLVDIVGGKTVNVYPEVLYEVSLADKPYVAYYTDNEVIHLAYQDVLVYSDIKNLVDVFENCPDGTTIKLAYNENGIVLEKNTYYEFSGKSVIFDLNGNTITRYNTTAYGAALIRLGEGASIKVTSTADGARVFLASKRNSTEEGDSNNRIFGADGIVHTNEGVDSANIEISNLEFNGGTMVKFCGSLSENKAPAWENNVTINCKIDNVVVYSPNRSSYATIVSLCPDVVVEVTNSSFYVTDATYAVFNDYKNDPEKGVYYRSEMDVTMKNCEVLCYTEGDSAKLAAFWHTMGAESSLCVENSTIIASLGGLKASSCKWGAGVEIATDDLKYFALNNVFTGVLYKTNIGDNAHKIALTFKRPDYTTDWSYVDEENSKLDDSCYNNPYVEITREYRISFVTYTEDSVPSYFKKVTWKAADGTELGTTDEILGAIPSSKFPAPSAANSNWYVVEYVWTNANGETVVVDGTNVFSPVAKYTAKIDGKKANMSLTTGMVFNLYLPLPDANVKVGSVQCGAAIESSEALVGSTQMLKLSFVSALDSFSCETVTINFTTADGVELSYNVKIDAMVYATLVAQNYECGSESAVLAYQIVAYKQAVAAYLGTELDDASNKAIADFKAIYAVADKHSAETCVCTADLYEDTDAAVLDYEGTGITGFAYLLNPTSNGLRINVGEGVVINSVSYVDLLKNTQVVPAENLKIFEEGYYVVSGIGAYDAKTVFTITIEAGDEDITVTYSLAQYIKSMEAAEKAAQN